MILWARDYQSDVGSAMNVIQEHSTLTGDQLRAIKDLLQFVLQPSS